MEESAPDLITHKDHWYTRPWGIGLGLFFLVVSGGFTGLLIRAYSDVVKEDRAKFTTSPAVNAQAVPQLDSATDQDDPTFGPTDAKVTIVEFYDFQCPFSKEVFPTVRRLMSEYSDQVRFKFRDYPVVDKNPFAEYAAQASQCAWEQGPNQFLALHDRMYINQSLLAEETIRSWAVLSGMAEPKFKACLAAGRYKSEVQTDYSDGVSLGVRGTPTFFLNGKKIEGVVPYDVFVSMIESELGQD